MRFAINCRAVCAVSAVCLLAGFAVATEPRDVPRLDGIEINGDAADWGDRGFRVETLAGMRGEIVAADDFDVRLRIGWDDRGLLVLVRVVDDVPTEYDQLDRLYRKDSLELFISDGVGSFNRFQIYVTTGADPAYGTPRTNIFDYRPDTQKTTEPTVTAASETKGKTTFVEVLLPWSNLDVEPSVGRVIGFQFYANDADGPVGYPTDWTRLVWHPEWDSHMDPDAVRPLRLSDKPGAAETAAILPEVFVERGRTEVWVVAAGEYVGEPVEARRNGKVLASQTLMPRMGRAVAELRVPLPAPGVSAEGTEVVIADSQREPLAFGNLEFDRAMAFADQEIRFEPYCFASPTLPKCDFARPLEAEQIIGPYRIEVTYYDAAFREVTEANEQGRYGAVIDIIPEHGRPARRYRTLYRQPAETPDSWWLSVRMDGSVMPLPAEGIDPRVAELHDDFLMEYAAYLWMEAGETDANHAALLAGMVEAKPDEPVAFHNDPQARDAQYWVTLKRKLYGIDERFAERCAAPATIEGEPATVLREGTEADAGFRPGSRDELDAFFQEWAEVSGEPFAVCIARRGVILIHEAYGEPMTVDTPAWLASITKLFGGTAVMMLVDQGLIDLDDPVSDVVPAFADSDSGAKMTVRDLFRHTSDLPHAYTPMVQDTDAMMAELARFAEPQRRFEYNTAACEMGARVIELVSGEPLATFYHRHLFGPLGCTGTTARGAGGDGMSIPLDMAKIGQMLLNKGAYGDKRFLSEEAVERMLPSSLADLPEASRPWSREAWGIGVAVMADEAAGEVNPYAAFGRQAFGHGAASTATFVIDPTRELVVVVTRNEPGRDFTRYAEQMTQTILENIEP